jgi:ribosomal protein S18 acetylase RimI-like enzyme
MVYSGIKYGEVYATSNNLEGIAVWFPSNNYPITFWKMLRSVPISKIFGFGKLGASKLKSFNEHIENIHRQHVPFKHWFLQAIGVTPRLHGKGYATKLLNPMLNRIDKEDLPCYLETILEKNVSLYEHFGFKTIDKSNIPETPLMNWAMLRKI